MTGGRHAPSARMAREAPLDPVELPEEQLAVGKREVERGRAVVRTRVEERDEVAEVELHQDEVTVERVPREVLVETMPAVHEEDGVLIIPVVEERMIVTKQLILKEEIRITRHRRTELVREAVRLRSEQVAVERQQGLATTVPDTEQRSSVDDGPNADGDVWHPRCGRCCLAAAGRAGYPKRRDLDPWRRDRHHGRDHQGGTRLLGQP